MRAEIPAAVVGACCYNIVLTCYFSCHDSACTPGEEEKDQAEKAWQKVSVFMVFFLKAPRGAGCLE